MPEYLFKCDNADCGMGFTQTLAIVNRNTPQECPKCHGPSNKVVAEGVGGVLRGDAWPGKNIRVKNQMHDRRQAVGERELALKMDGPQFELAPNVGGERVDSWDDAAKLAASVGKDPTEYEKRAHKVRQRGKRA